MRCNSLSESAEICACAAGTAKKLAHNMSRAGKFRMQLEKVVIEKRRSKPWGKGHRILPVKGEVLYLRRALSLNGVHFGYGWPARIAKAR